MRALGLSPITTSLLYHHFGNKCLHQLVTRPPCGNIRTGLDALRRMLDTISDKYSNCEKLIMGDFNINYANKSCNHVQSLLTIEPTYNLKQLINTPTRVSLKSSSLIDQCFTDMANVRASGVVNYPASDHLPTFVVKKKVKLQARLRTFKG